MVLWSFVHLSTKKYDIVNKIASKTKDNYIIIIIIIIIIISIIIIIIIIVGVVFKTEEEICIHLWQDYISSF